MQIKRNLALVLGIVLIMGSFAGACSKAPATVTVAAPPTTAAPTSKAATAAPTTAAAPTYEKLNLKYANPMAPSLQSNGIHEHWAKLVSDKTGGALKIETVSGGALLNDSSMLTGVASGLADLGWFRLGLNPTIFPYTVGASWLDFDKMLSINSEATCEAANKAASILDNEFGVIQSHENNGLKYLFSIAVVGACIFTNKPVNTVADFNGMKMRIWRGKWHPKLWEAVGATGITMAYSDMYEGMQKGVINGCDTTTTVYRDSKLHQVGPYRTYFGDGKGVAGSVNLSNFSSVMTLSLWNKLSPAMKKAMLEAAKEAEVWGSRGMYADHVKADQDMTKEGLKTTYLSAEDLKKWNSQPGMKPAMPEVVTEINKLGGNGDAYFKRVEEIAKLSASDIDSLWKKYWDKRIAELW